MSRRNRKVCWRGKIQSGVDDQASRLLNCCSGGRQSKHQQSNTTSENRTIAAALPNPNVYDGILIPDWYNLPKLVYQSCEPNPRVKLVFRTASQSTPLWSTNSLDRSIPPGTRYNGRYWIRQKSLGDRTYQRNISASRKPKMPFLRAVEFLG